jgi:hypothetical protein
MTNRADGRRSSPGSDLLNVSVLYGDRWYDPAVGLLWNPAGSFAPVVRDASVHLLPQSAWYAFGLLERGGPGDRERALVVLDAVLGHQYDRPGTPWNGTFSQVAEQPEPTAGARQWVDYDPNWRQFIGTTLLLVLRHHTTSLDQGLRARIDQALDLAVRGEPAGRVTPDYTNIAVMKAVLEVEYGATIGDASLVAAGEDLAAAVVARFDRHGSFDEFNSPTYYGIDLVGLALWRTCAASPRLQEWGARLEAALWEDIAMFFHAGLGNLVGPHSRTYGTDMGRYLAAVGLWWWPAFGRAAAPLPDIDATSIDHGHDLLLGPLVARLAGRVPAGLAEFLTSYDGVRQIERRISDDPERVATAWLEPNLAFGAEGGAHVQAASGQFAPAMIHWRAAGLDAPTAVGPTAVGPGTDGVGTARVFCDDPTEARATDGVLRVTTLATDPSDPADLVVLISTGADAPLAPPMVEPGRWNLPGLTVRVQSNGSLAGAEMFGDDLLVTYRTLSDGHRLVVRTVGDA